MTPCVGEPQARPPHTTCVTAPAALREVSGHPRAPKTINTWQAAAVAIGGRRRESDPCRLSFSNVGTMSGAWPCRNIVAKGPGAVENTRRFFSSRSFMGPWIIPPFPRPAKPLEHIRALHLTQRTPSQASRPPLPQAAQERAPRGSRWTPFWAGVRWGCLARPGLAVCGQPPGRAEPSRTELSRQRPPSPSPKRAQTEHAGSKGEGRRAALACGWYPESRLTRHRTRCFPAATCSVTSEASGCWGVNLTPWAYLVAN